MASLQSLDRDMGKAFDRIKDGEDDVKRLGEQVAVVAQLAALTSRDTEELKSKVTVTCWLSGTLKDATAASFKRYQEAGKAERAAAAREGRKSKPPESSWKVEFGKLVANWAKDQVGDGGAKADLREALQPVLTELACIDPGAAIDFVRMNPTEPPPLKPWCVTLSVSGTQSGARLFEVLTVGLKCLYRTKVGESTVPSELACRPETSDRDRPLTAQVAELGGLKVRAGRGKGGGKNGGGGALKRESPARGSQGREKTRR